MLCFFLILFFRLNAAKFKLPIAFKSQTRVAAGSAVVANDKIFPQSWMYRPLCLYLDVYSKLHKSAALLLQGLAINVFGNEITLVKHFFL